MFTDITGFSAMMQKSERRASMVRSRHRSVFKDAHAKYNGKILQYFGDGTLSIFESVSDAVECAVDMQIEFRKEPEVPLRIGIHTGDITYDDEGAYGNSMNIASRVENIAVPGSIFITSKVYDDIKNHAWLTAIHLGSFQLRNIFHPVDIYSVTSKGMVVPHTEDLAILPERIDEQQTTASQIEPTGGRRKGVAALLALFFGIFGAHRFYLGQRGKGIAMLVISVIAIMASATGDIPLIAVMGIIAFVDFIVLLAMPKAEFNRKYNTPAHQKVPASTIKKSQLKRAKRPMAKSLPKIKEDPTKKIFDEGVREYKKGRYNDAIERFDLVLSKRPSDYLAHFYLARIFTLMYDSEDAFHHLEKSIEYGFDDFEWLDEDPALRYLRSHKEYEAFKKNGFKRPLEVEEEVNPDLLADIADHLSTLEKIELLGDRMERGEITRDQFEQAKHRLLNDD